MVPGMVATAPVEPAGPVAAAVCVKAHNETSVSRYDFMFLEPLLDRVVIGGTFVAYWRNAYAESATIDNPGLLALPFAEFA